MDSASEGGLLRGHMSEWAEAASLGAGISLAALQGCLIEVVSLNGTTALHRECGLVILLSGGMHRALPTLRP